MRTMCRSKLHGATITQTDINYEGSITLDVAMLKAANILPYERVQIVNMNNGSRPETYVIPGGPGEVCLNGPAARLAEVGDKVHIIAYGIFSEEEALKAAPIVVHLGEKNSIKRIVKSPTAAEVMSQSDS